MGSGTVSNDKREAYTTESGWHAHRQAYMDAASRLLRSQFPHLQGLQSSLISQSRNGFNPVEVSQDCVPKGMYVKTNHHTSTNNRPTPKAFDDYWIVFITAMQIMFDDARHHWFLTTLNDGGVSIHDSLKPNTLTPALEKQLTRLYGPTMSRDATGLCISATSVQQQKGSCDCGLFAVAFAFHLASGGDSKDMVFDQSRMRNHFIHCFVKKRLSQFPTTSERVIAPK